MEKEVVQKAASEFLWAGDDKIIAPLGNGLINHTYKVVDHNGRKAMLQAINTNVFTRPEDVTGNYKLIFDFLHVDDHAVHIPPPLECRKGGLLWKDSKGNCWRANGFIEGSYSPNSAETETAAFTVANSFARFTRSLAGIAITKLKPTIIAFHDLSFRYRQFEEALAKASQERLLKSTHIISELKQRRKLVSFYESTRLGDEYPDRAMHHDCKISNILFASATDTVICPVDLDTTMPGKFFSDLGDMIRTMACSADENSVEWEKITVRPLFYAAILKGYLDGAGDIFTKEEAENIHYSGLILTYMQALRFIADYLNDDIYYKTSYPGQNLNRSLNQLLLLKQLEAHLDSEYGFAPYLA